MVIVFQMHLIFYLSCNEKERGRKKEREGERERK